MYILSGLKRGQFPTVGLIKKLTFFLPVALFEMVGMVEYPTMMWYNGN